MKVSVPGMPVTLLNMSKNDIYKMVSGGQDGRENEYLSTLVGDVTPSVLVR